MLLEKKLKQTLKKPSIKNVERPNYSFTQPAIQSPQKELA
ncbi:hypothetical protein EV13_1699 [Prochlorococcus sp. MIT 0702]|nr:hypothetical protein EV12_2218 [Prochlorococcus sp. MIT 0701]KGG28040.1 hypothetical protein EV13_1699 [Prochlorococcus sp. MIT 0702]KGG33657.1 hypothetical protein EV14_1607 [Prochlorococcus sp. MIT 0703]